MPSCALLLCSGAAVLGALAVTPLDFDVRIVAGAGSIALAAACACVATSRLSLLVAAFFAASAANAALRQPASPPTEQRTARYGATLMEAIAAADGTTAVTLLLDDGRRITARVAKAVPEVGAHLIVRGRLEPFDEVRNPGEPSEAAIERERGFDAKLDGAQILSETRQADSNSRTWLARAHAWAGAQLRERLGEPAASVVAGELWGERSALPPFLRAEFQETGTVHVLVTAGLHLGAVAALAAALLASASLPRWATCAATIAAIWVFAWWSGAQLPAIRAATMATAALTARACGRATFSWNALALAGIFIAFLHPASIATTSFALSFSCVAAIFAYAAPLERWVESRIALPDRVREAVVLSSATQLGIWPLAAATFLQFTPYAVAANVAVVPCVAATMALGAAQLAFAWCAPIAQAFANCNSWLLAWMLGVVESVSALPGASIAMTPAPAWCIGAYDAALLSAPLLWRRNRTLAIAAAMLATI